VSTRPYVFQSSSTLPKSRSKYLEPDLPKKYQDELRKNLGNHKIAFVN